MVMKSATTAALETRTITAAEFKAKCLHLMDEVNEGKFALTITKRGKPVVHITAPKPQEEPFLSIVGRSPNVRILGDIICPLDWGDPAEKWAKSSHRKKKKHK